MTDWQKAMKVYVQPVERAFETQEWADEITATLAKLEPNT
jgi:hypothetical protein